MTLTWPICPRSRAWCTGRACWAPVCCCHRPPCRLRWWRGCFWPTALGGRCFNGIAANARANPSAPAACGLTSFTRPRWTAPMAPDFAARTPSTCKNGWRNWRKPKCGAWPKLPACLTHGTAWTNPRGAKTSPVWRWRKPGSCTNYRTTTASILPAASASAWDTSAWPTSTRCTTWHWRYTNWAHQPLACTCTCACTTRSFRCWPARPLSSNWTPCSTAAQPKMGKTRRFSAPCCAS